MINPISTFSQLHTFRVHQWMTLGLLEYLLHRDVRATPKECLMSGEAVITISHFEISFLVIVDPSAIKVRAKVHVGITIGKNWGDPKTSPAMTPSSSRIDQASSLVEWDGPFRAILCNRPARRDGTAPGRAPFSGFPPKMAIMQRALMVISNCAVRDRRDRVDCG
jgi:hypothetical protein